MSDSLTDILKRAPVIPVIVIHDVKDAIPLADALVAGGLPVLEVTLRTSAGLAAIEAMRRAIPEAIVGVGTITEPAHFAAAARAGAQFGVSPGLTPALTEAGRAAGFPFLPGIMTPGELLSARESGHQVCKLFPAQQAGGIGMLRALHSVFPDVRFCPTGGVSLENAADYLAVPNVLCVGGSWVTPNELIRNGDWLGIRKLAQEAAALRKTPAAG